jgi:hypothetical protein
MFALPVQAHGVFVRAASVLRPAVSRLVRLVRGCGLSVALLMAAVASLATACAPRALRSADTTQPNEAGAAAECPAHAPAKPLLPGVQPEEQTLGYWLQRYSPAELDAPLMDNADITAYNARVGRRLGREVYGQRDLRVPADSLALAEDVRERISQLRPDVDAGKLVARTGQPLTAAERGAFAEPIKYTPASLRVLLEPSLLRCGPYAEGLYKAPVQLAYDHNACGNLRAQEPIELLGTSGQLSLVRTRYALGFLSSSARLSPPVPSAEQALLLAGPRSFAEQPLNVAAAGGTLNLASGTSLPVANNGQVLLASANGIKRATAPPGLRVQAGPLTRRGLFTAAFEQLGKPYGLGGAQGGSDCSGFLLDIFERFDIALPRYSGWQAQAGSYGIDVRGLSSAQKLQRLDLAAKSGIVLLQFPGHIVLYLGRSSSGVPMAVHALGEYLEPCAKGETVVDVQRVVVSGLELGRNSSRGSFVERATRLVVFGPTPSAPPAGLEPGLAPPPQAAARDESCQDSTDNRIFISPAQPEAGQALRAVAVSQRDPNPASLRIFDADGDAVPIDEFPLGGPPYARVARIAKARAGAYTIVLGSASQRLACRRVRVRDAAVARGSAPESDPVWEPHTRWERDNEALYAVFVEQLFSGPPDDEQTWTNLHSLLRDPNRNLLYDHLGLGEEERLEIEPDCADLPYSLRAYFAWKLRLPYAYRLCTRGRSGQPPACGEMHSSLMQRKAADEVQSFSQFVNRSVRDGVHSATGRTSPSDSETDLYPIALDRSALAPGTVYADPYGHVMMISKWFAQGSLTNDPYGVLMAAEAQPDGTIGRRRFWQGSFLFDPSTVSVGAGFKRFRPLSYDPHAQSLRSLDNAELAKSHEFAPYSRMQYEGSREDFYDRMEELINPKPLAPSERMQSLVAALDEAVRRRVLSIDNGEHYFAAHPRATIGMPQGADIFETEGAWEDYATPSRDMRLLIAIDTVNALPTRVEQKPERFAIPADTSPKAAADALRGALANQLRTRSFEYTRSDGSTQSLHLADVIARADALELAYNPNDCAELRWGAPAGSAERASCVRNAPAAQRSRMQAYRTWFHTRTRPARGE